MSGKRSRSRIAKFIPIVDWLTRYNQDKFNSDIFAGIITAILFVPQGIAYAMLAGLPAQVGLYASILPPLIYAFLGTSRTLSVGPVSIAAIMIASALAAPELAQYGSATQHAIILAAEGGIILLLMSLFRMGGLVKFISHPVLAGFTSGASILIIFSQLPHLFGIAKNDCGFDLFCQSQSINLYSSAIGLFSVALLFFMAKPLTRWLKSLSVREKWATGISKTAPLLAVIITTFFVSAFHLYDHQQVAIVGQIPNGLPDFGFDFVFSGLDHWIALLPSAIFISLIAYVESVAIALVTANLRNEKINTNQELIALGTANIATAFSGGMSVAGGFSRTMVNFSAGARTQLAMIIAVVLLAIALVSFTEQFTHIPKATLAAIILIAIIPLIKISEIIDTFQHDRSDAATQLITLLAVLILGIEEGIALGVIVTIIIFLRRTSLPHIAVVGQVAGTEQFRNIERHSVITWPELLLIRIDENITFANIAYITEFISEQADKRPELEHIVLKCSSVSYIDTTAFEAIDSFVKGLENRSLTLNLSEVKGPVMDKLSQMHIDDHLSKGRVFFHTIDAIKALVKTAT
jgi:SulP family sulfate permease